MAALDSDRASTEWTGGLRSALEFQLQGLRLRQADEQVVRRDGDCEQALAGRNWTLTEFEEILRERCAWLAEQRESLRSRTRYHWWPDDRAA